MCEGRPTSPECKAVTEKLVGNLKNSINALAQLTIAIERTITIVENPEPRISNPSAMARIAGNMRLLENGDTENENFSDLDAAIKGKSANLSEVIVDLIITNQVGDKPERIRGIRLKIARFVKDLKAMEIADIKPEIKKEISDRMKASMSAILEEILTH